MVRRSGRAPNSGWKPRSASQPVQRPLGDLQGDPLGVQSAGLLQHQPGDLAQLLAPEAAKDDDLVNPVEELRPELRAEQLHQRLP